jgi:hypothetical protein
LWKEHKAFLKEEAAAARMWEHNQRVGYKKDSPIERAVEQVFENVKDDVGFYRGVVSGSPEAFGLVRTRAEFEDWRESGDLNPRWYARRPMGPRFPSSRRPCEDPARAG